MSILKKIWNKLFVFKIAPFAPGIPAPGSGRRIDIDNTDRQNTKSKMARDPGDSRVKYNRTQHK